MIECVEAQFDLTPEPLTGVTAYGTAPLLAWMVEEKDIKPHVPAWNETSARMTASPVATSTGIRKPMNIAARRQTATERMGRLHPEKITGVVVNEFWTLVWG